MPRGSKPGERRGGRQRGTPNKKTALVKVAFAAATSNADLSPLDFLLGVMRDPSVSPDLRMRAAEVAARYVHPKAGGAQTNDSAVTKELESLEKPNPPDPKYQFSDAMKAFERALAEDSDRIERLRAAQKGKTSFNEFCPLKQGALAKEQPFTLDD